MALSNRDRVERAMDLLMEGLTPFVDRHMRARYGEGWRTTHLETDHLDSQRLLKLVWDEWREVFSSQLGFVDRSMVSELREWRNKWAHQEAFTTEDAYRALDTASRLLLAVGAPDQANAVREYADDLLRLRFEEGARRGARKALALAGTPQGGLKPWRMVVTPHADVRGGRYQQAEFAADLHQVTCGRGSSEYRDPEEFFRRTYLTEGLRKLLVNAVQRLSGLGGDPVVSLQTNFGGGKTHSMLALYHLFSGVEPSKLQGVPELLGEAGVSALPKRVQRVVVVGTQLKPGSPDRKDDGTVVRTLWGELAWQLDGAEAYEMVREADETGTNPGASLRELLELYSPCLILIDEWVAYARQLYGDEKLPAGTFDTHFTFAQTLTEAVKSLPEVLLVASLPESDIEIGGTGGHRALERLQNVVGRVESPWRPATAQESFEIVRRRLFEPLTDAAKLAQRDAVVQAFQDLYATHSEEFPSGCREREYARRIEAEYPIHPELFDRLFQDWSALERFQRTRGVLRLMAAVIRSLWEREDGNLLILPATVPIDDPIVQSELTRYLEEAWSPVIQTDVDGEDSVPARIDREHANLGRFSACRRVARTVYLGSAPTSGSANRGIEERKVKLGCVQPGENVAVFGDALHRLTGASTHLYVDGQRYWYSTVPTVAKLARDRAEQVSAAQIEEGIRQALAEDARQRGGFAAVHTCPASGADVEDDRCARLVILSPATTYATKSGNGPAIRAAQEILDRRGSSPRTYRNTLVFLAADADRLPELEQSVRDLLAWQSIVDDAGDERLNLDAFQRRQAETKLAEAKKTVASRVGETYVWLLVPLQEPAGPVTWQAWRLRNAGSLSERAFARLVSEDVLKSVYGGALLRMELDRVPLWRGDHVAIRQLLNDFAQYLYLPKLRNDEVLLAAIRDGVGNLAWTRETFAFAAAYDEGSGRYLGLRAGESVSAVPDTGLLVKPEVAEAQSDADKRDRKDAAGEGSGEGAAASAGEVAPPPAERKPRRFYGAVKLNALRVGDDAARIAAEVVSHLAGQLKADVRVTLEIEAEVPDEFPETVIHTVSENCHTLGFRSHGFEP